MVEPAIIRQTEGEPALQTEPDRALLEAGFIIADGMLKPLRGDEFETQPILMLRMLKLARDRKLRLHPLAVRALIRHERPRRVAAR